MESFQPINYPTTQSPLLIHYIILKRNLFLAYPSSFFICHVYPSPRFSPLVCILKRILTFYSIHAQTPAGWLNVYKIRQTKHTHRYTIRIVSQ